MPPLRLTDSQSTSIFAAARPLALQDRDPFLQEVAGLLAGIVDPGDGDVARAIRAVQQQCATPFSNSSLYYHPLPALPKMDLQQAADTSRAISTKR
jgi:hypothetical protein